MLDQLRQLLILIAAAGAAAPPLAVELCGCGGGASQVAAKAPSASCCSQATGRRSNPEAAGPQDAGRVAASCCSHKSTEAGPCCSGDAAGGRLCLAAGGCDCQGCGGNRTPSPFVSTAHEHAAASTQVVATVSYVAPPVGWAPGSDTEGGHAAPVFRPPAPPGVRLQALLCVWTI